MADIHCEYTGCRFNKDGECSAVFLTVNALAECETCDPSVTYTSYKAPILKTVIASKCQKCGAPCFVYGFIRPEQTAKEVLQGTPHAICNKCDPSSAWRQGYG